MDETVDTSNTADDQADSEATASPLMPLSMPPMGTRSESPSPREPTTRSSNAVDTSLMPLSMPPFHQVAPPAIAPNASSWSAGGDHHDHDGHDHGVPINKSRRGFVLLAVVALCFGGLGAGLGATFGGSTNAPSNAIIPAAPVRPTIGSTPASRVYAAVEPAVVDINTNIATTADEQTEQAAGTGMIVTSSGEVLTNNHVIENATSITVTVQGRTGPIRGQFPAKVIGDDPTDDVALIQIQNVSGLHHVSIGNSSNVVVGDAIYAIGNALGLGGQPTVQSGVVSALNRSISAQNDATSLPESLHGLIQMNAAIQPGDSGGPLVNAHGQVIGMDTAAASTDGSSSAPVGFAIPINHARTIANQIASGKSGGNINIGYASFLGVQIAQSNSNNGGGFNNGGFGFSVGSGNTGTTTPAITGALIAAVVPNSAAATSGLQAGDTITAINGTKIKTTTLAIAANQVQTLLSKYAPGDSVAVTYLDQQSASHVISVKLGGIPR